MIRIFHYELDRRYLIFIYFFASYAFVFVNLLEIFYIVFYVA